MRQHQIREFLVFRGDRNLACFGKPVPNHRQSVDSRSFGSRLQSELYTPLL